MDTGQSKMMKPFAPWDGFIDYWVGLWAAWEIKASAGMAFAAVCSFFDVDERMIAFLCVAVIADFLLGVSSAIKRDRFKCRAVEYGILKIVYYAVYIGTVGLVNVSLSISLGYRLPLLDLFISYLVATDCISITGHLRAMGVPVPPLLVAILKKVRNRAEKDTAKALKGKERPREED